MSLRLNQRTNLYQNRALKKSSHFLSIKWSVLSIALTTAVFGQSVSAESLLTANQPTVREIQDRSSFEQILEQIRTYQANQSSWQTQQNMASAQLKQSGLWANPSISIEQTGLQSNQDQELAIGISQPLDLFGQRKAAQKVAKLSANQVDLEQQRYNAELALIVQYAWSQVALWQLEKSLIAEQLQVSQQNLEATEKRYQAGSIAQVDVERVRIAHLENQRIYQQADLQLQVAQQQLASFWGSDSNQYRISPSVNELWSRATQVKVDQEQIENLFERSLQLENQRQQASIEQLKAKSRPQPTMTLGVNRTRSVDQNTENQLRLGVEIPLNIFNKQKYGIQIAEAKQTLIQQQQRFYRQQNQMDIDVRLAELKGLQAQFQLLNNQQIPLATQVQQKTLQGFRLGKFAVTDVQQATVQLQDVRLRKVQLLKQAWQLSVEVQSARMGLPVEQITAKDALMQLNQRVWQQSNAFPNQLGE
ncbi:MULTISPECIES: TolC family protein [Acinetobacter]|uniref:TolC family protein n=1 Tax=Acinetobacter TaxID=469 RepID=UPI000235F24B|nr:MULTISPECIES: TolC family protein [Acinetobacter]KXZ71690.1 Cobalt-zinc-cadmium resistance protein CzcC precursor [Acinetobacter venetianus]GAB01338.1 putative cation efflux system protein [Acinetobacter sp. NBRC 100985]